VAAGLARLEQEREAIAARVRFEQYFSAELAEQLTLQPNLLEGRDTEVTVLFVDIRGFSRVAERMGATGTMAWINDVLDVLSDCVIRHGGVLVDYVGDELLAMWGAPVAQPDHAQRAARAAVEMWKSLPEFNARWADRVGVETKLGIGINSGPARVGNTGSHRKFKYGPLGNTVNLGSRVQGATKHLRAGVLVTAAAQRQLDRSFGTRRLCQVRVVNIVEPVTLYELRPVVEPGWDTLCKAYGDALGCFEAGDLPAALEQASLALSQFPDDGPSQVLRTRVEAALADSTSPFNPVWELSGK
jgi:adenylate cyclase